MGENARRLKVTPVITVAMNASPETTSYDVETQQRQQQQSRGGKKERKGDQRLINGMLCINLFILCELAVDLAVSEVM